MLRYTIYDVNFIYWARHGVGHKRVTADASVVGSISSRGNVNSRCKTILKVSLIVQKYSSF